MDLSILLMTQMITELTMMMIMNMMTTTVVMMALVVKIDFRVKEWGGGFSNPAMFNKSYCQQ